MLRNSWPVRLVVLFFSVFSVLNAIAKADGTQPMVDRSLNCDDLLAAAAQVTPLSPSEINYQVHGAEHSETVVLIHGLDSAIFTFQPIIEPLSQKYKVVVYDQRGHGKTVARGHDYSTQVMAADLLALLDHLRIEKAHVLGHSMGARTAMRFAALHPERLQSLIVEDMELMRRADPSTEAHERSSQRAEAAKALEERTYASRDELTEALTPFYGSESKSLTYRRAKENEDGSMTLLFRPSVSFLYGYQGNAEDFTAELQDLKAPLLVLKSDPTQGTALTDQGAQHISNSQPNALIESFIGAGHVIHRTHTLQFLDLLGEFLETQTLSTGSRGKYATKPLREKGSIDLSSSLSISDDRQRVAQLTEVRAAELSSDQMETLVQHSEQLVNSFEIGQYIRIASESAHARWIKPLMNWIQSWNDSQVGWQSHMQKTAYKAYQNILQSNLHQSGKHPNVGTEWVNFSKEVLDAGMLPRGSALITQSGALKETGITAIIHAASGSASQTGGVFEPTLQSVQVSVANSMALARAHGHKRLAVPFIGGRIFAQRIGIEPQALAKAILEIAAEERGDLEVCIVTFLPEESAVFEKARAEMGLDSAETQAVTLAPGSITDFNVHHATAIVNAANMEVVFGGGLSGAIAKATKAAAAIDQEAANAIRDLNRDLENLLSQ